MPDTIGGPGGLEKSHLSRKESRKKSSSKKNKKKKRDRQDETEMVVNIDFDNLKSSKPSKNRKGLKIKVEKNVEDYDRL